MGEREREMLAMEKDFDAKLKIEGNSSNGGNVQRSKSFAFRAPQENFTVQDFELGRIYGVGSYSKVVLHLHCISQFSFISFSVSHSLILLCYIYHKVLLFLLISRFP